MQLPRRPVLVCLASAAAAVGVFALAVLLVREMRVVLAGEVLLTRAACVVHDSTTEALLGHTRRAPVPVCREEPPSRVFEPYPWLTSWLPRRKDWAFRVGEHVLLYARIGGRTVMRPYTPVSRVDHRGSFDIMVKIYPAGITAVETHLGWTIQGSLRNLTQGSGEHATSLFIAIEDTSERDAALEAGVTNCWRLDSLEFQDDPDGSQGNSMALELFKRAISKVGERYEVPLLIQEPGLDNEQGNYILAKQRLLIQLHRFRPQPDFLARYEDTLKAYFNDYHAEQVPDEDLTPKPNTYYMPHQIRRDAVITKLQGRLLRVISRSRSTTPNNVVIKRLKVDADLLKLLHKFRMHPIIMVADIKKAYLQTIVFAQTIEVHCASYGSIILPTEHYPFPPIVHWRTTCVPFGAKSSSARRDVTSPFPTLQKAILRNIGVSQTVISRRRTCRQPNNSEAKTILADAGMEIRKWASNSFFLAGQFRTDQLSLEDDGGDPLTTKGPKGRFLYEGRGQFSTDQGRRLPLVTRLGLVAAGSGVTPMLQLLRHLLADNADQTTVMMIDVNSSEQDIIAHQELEEYAQHLDTFSIRHVLSRPPTSEDMVDYVPGPLNLEVMTEHLPPPNSGTMVLCCGPPRFIAGIYEPALRKIGHKPNHVLCF
ncbi:hypothetical protein MRX96_049725 [Rhipicephalus microplus]